MTSLVMKFLKSRIKINDIVLDVGCGDRVCRIIRCKKMVSLDVWKRANPDILLDLNKNDLPYNDPINNPFDVICFLDIIEHLDKERGFQIIEQAKNIVKREIILVTPLLWSDNSINTTNPNSFHFNNPHNYHRSLWSLKDFNNEWKKDSNIEKVDHKFCGIWIKN